MIYEDMKRILYASDYSMESDGCADVTGKLQKLTDEAGRLYAKLVLPKGTYLCGSLFLRSHMEFHLEEGAVLLGMQEESAYPLMLNPKIFAMQSTQQGFATP